MGDDQLVTKSFTGDTHRVSGEIVRSIASQFGSVDNSYTHRISGETSVLETLVCSPTTTH